MRWRGRPRPGRGTFTCSRVASISLTSAGEAEASVPPIGTPWPSTTTIHFVPLPRLVLPTNSPLFSPEQSCRRRRSLPSLNTASHPARLIALARYPARYPNLPKVLDAASRSLGLGIVRAGRASGHRFVAPRESPPGLG